MAPSPMHPFLRLLRERATTEAFDPRRALTEEEVRDLVTDAARAPSSFNIQHWRFVAVRSAEGKRRLRAAAFGQAQVADAAVTFIVLGDTRGVEKLPAILEEAVRVGALPAAKGEAWMRMATEIYSDAQVARDEAMRSGSLAAMALMLAAEARGLGTAALSGFDVARVRREFDVDERYVAVMLLAVGHPAGAAGPRQPRLPADEVLAFERGRRF